MALQVYMVDIIATEYEAKCSAIIVVVNAQADALGSGSCLKWYLVSRVKLTMHHEPMGIGKPEFSTGHHNKSVNLVDAGRVTGNILNKGAGVDIEIPDSHDPEWVQMMLSQFAGNIEALQSIDCCGTRARAKELLDDCSQIVDALQQYAGY